MWTHEFTDPTPTTPTQNVRLDCLRCGFQRLVVVHALEIR